MPVQPITRSVGESGNPSFFLTYAKQARLRRYKKAVSLYHELLTTNSKKAAIEQEIKRKFGISRVTLHRLLKGDNLIAWLLF